MRLLITILCLAMVSTVFCRDPVFAQSDELLAANSRVNALNNSEQYREALPHLKRVLELAKKEFGLFTKITLVQTQNLGWLYEKTGQLAEAEQLYKRCLTISKKLARLDPSMAGYSLYSLAELLRSQNRYAEAEPIFKRALVVRSKVVGSKHSEIGQILSGLGLLLESQARYTEAEPVFQRAINLYENEFGPNHPYVAGARNNLGILYHAQGRYIEAEPLFRNFLNISKMARVPDDLAIRTAVNNLAITLLEQGRFGEAETLSKRALLMREKANGANHPEVGQSLINLAGIYREQGRYALAEPLLKRSLNITENVLGPSHIDLSTGLNLLALLYVDQGRFDEGEQLFKRSLAISESVFGPKHPRIGTGLNNLASLYYGQNRYAEAETLYRRALEIDEKELGKHHPSTALTLNNLGMVYLHLGRYAEAEPLLVRSLKSQEKSHGPDHREVARSTHSLGDLYWGLNRYAQAENLYKRSLAIYTRTLGSNHPSVGGNLNSLATLYFNQGDWSQASLYGRRATQLLIRRSRRQAGAIGKILLGKKRTDASRKSRRFRTLIKSTYRLDGRSDVTKKSVRNDMFQTAQWAQSSQAAASLAQMAARGVSPDPKLAKVIRDRQDLVAEWQKRDQLHIASVGRPPGQRNMKIQASNFARLVTVDERIAAINKYLANNAPDYARLVSSEPLSIKEVQDELRNSEALVLFLDTLVARPAPEETFIWVVTKNGARWVRSPMGTKTLEREVNFLRCGLDPALWNDYPTLMPGDGPDVKRAKKSRQNKMEECLETFPDGEGAHGLLPFDLTRSHALYKTLFGEVEDLIKGKDLLIVPSGPLTQLPFQVLVTKRPDPSQSGTASLRKAAWLTRNHTISVLPAVSSLKALRDPVTTSKAKKSFIGFGNPLLIGKNGNSNHAKRATLARAITSCKTLSTEDVRSRLTSLGSATLLGGNATSQTRSRDLALVQRQIPVPETASQLCIIARATNAGGSDIYLAADASEDKLKKLSKDGKLAQYRVIQFATHGLLAGELNANSEPGLILTPPPGKGALDNDDGFLSASEITGLKLDADWVVLSACNTAAGGAKNAEALSGLARAFIYAGTRALLVSHWSNYSNSTSQLVSSAVAGAAKSGRAKALQTAMLKMIDKGPSPRWAHPTYWAPFILVGEGALGK